MANVISKVTSNSVSVYASAARTTTPDTQELELPGGISYGMFVLNATALASTPSIVMKVEGVDRTTGTTWLILEDAAVTTAAPTQSTLEIGPEIAAVANVSATRHLPPVIRITVTHGDADSITYAVGANFA